MKHYLRFLITLILATVWCAGGYAQETATLKFTKSCNGKGTDDKNGSWVISSDGKESTFSSTQGVHYGSGSSSASYLSISSSSYSSYAISKIVVNASGNTANTPKISCSVGGNAFGDTYNITSSNAEYKFEGNSSGDILISIKRTSAAKKPLYLLSVEVTYTKNVKKLASIAVSGEPTKTTYNVGDEFDPTGLVVTGTYDDNSIATITDGITWTKTPATLSVGTTSCSVTATVDGVTSKPFEVTGLTVDNNISLTIDPATYTVVKAPVTVTLTATGDATVYYTTDGSEPTTSSTKYDTPFEVTKSGTTVKAIAVAEGAENATAEATYTIQPDQPVFSDASKTFKDAFAVTLSLPKTTDETSTIHYAINGTATAGSDEYTAPVNISAENDGDKVILHAVVVDKYGNVGKEKFCTYTKSTDIVFDFTGSWDGITAVAGSNNTKNGTQVVTGKELQVNGVVMTATNGTTSNTTYYTGLYTGGTDPQTLRVYSNGSITFTAPEGYNLSEILYDFNQSGTFITTENKWETPTWTGNAHTVTFKCTKSSRIYTATIKLVAAETPEATSGNLTFKALNSDGYYATFSSDKNVVFTDDVVVYGISVANGKLSLNDFNKASYEVTDAIGNIGKGYYVPANTGVVVNCIDETATYYFPKTEVTPSLPANLLVAAPANGGEFTPKDGYKYYKLAYNDYDAQTGLGFYWGADNGGAFSVKAGSAYLAVPTSEANNAKGFSFNGDVTGINSVNVSDNASKTIYNLNGQRVSRMSQAGLYIVNGKKVVIRK